MSEQLLDELERLGKMLKDIRAVAVISCAFDEIKLLRTALSDRTKERDEATLDRNKLCNEVAMWEGDASSICDLLGITGSIKSMPEAITNGINQLRSEVERLKKKKKVIEKELDSVFVFDCGEIDIEQTKVNLCNILADVCEIVEEL